MLTDAERSRKEERIEISKRLLKMGGQNKDGLPESRKAQKAREEAKKELEAEQKQEQEAHKQARDKVIVPFQNYGE